MIRRQFSCITTFMIYFSTMAAAGEQEDVAACISAIELFSNGSVSVDTTDLPEWTPRLFSPNTVEWNSVVCEIGSGSVVGLVIGDTVLIREGFAGTESKQLYDGMQARVDEVRSEFRERVKRLEGALADAEAILRQPSPDLEAVGRAFEAQVLFALGSSAAPLHDDGVEPNGMPLQLRDQGITSSSDNPDAEPRKTDGLTTNAVDNHGSDSQPLSRVQGGPDEAEMIASAMQAYDAGNYQAAFAGLRLAADRGDVDAQFKLALIFDVGGIEEVERNMQEAVRYYEMAANQGHASSQLQLGHIYGMGDGVTQNYSEMVRWLSKAAEQGIMEAQHYLGEAYAEGKGVNVDRSLAHMWLTFASEAGLERSALALTALETEMTQNQIARAKELAREWMRTDAGQ